MDIPLRTTRSARAKVTRRATSIDRTSLDNVQKGSPASQPRSPSSQPLTRSREAGSVQHQQSQMMSTHRQMTSLTGKAALEGNGVKVEYSPQSIAEPGQETALRGKDLSTLAVEEELRPDSKTDSDESSIALDCHTGPTEVIVKGRNVRKIHVKFPPRPPSAEIDMVRAGAGMSVPRQMSHLSLINRSVSSGQQPQEHGDEFEYKPLSQDGRHTPPRSVPSALPAIDALPTQSTAVVGEPHRDSGMLSAISLDLGLNSGVYEWDRKVKHDIINGIEYFEKKNQEMKEINCRLLRELDRIARLNSQYEEVLKREEERTKILAVENDELKVKLDGLEKDNGKLREESMSYWKSRVKSEELYIELKHKTEKEMKGLMEQVQVKDKEVNQLRNMNRVQKAEKSKHQVDDQFELLHKISRLEDEIARLKCEREQMNDTNHRQKDEVDGLKRKIKEQSSELENRFSQFLVLKKSFNNLNTENEKLKSQLRSRRSTQQLSINNNTWPKNTDPKKTETEAAVSYFDIPSKVAKSGPKKTSVTMLGHKRNPSDTHSNPDSLPPVPSPIK